MSNSVDLTRITGVLNEDSVLAKTMINHGAIIFFKTSHLNSIYSKTIAGETWLPYMPTLGIGWMISINWNQLQLLPIPDTSDDQCHIFPRLTLAAYFPSLDTGCLFSLAWHWLHVFPHLTLVEFFSALLPAFLFRPRFWLTYYRICSLFRLDRST